MTVLLSLSEPFDCVTRTSTKRNESKSPMSWAAMMPGSPKAAEPMSSAGMRKIPCRPTAMSAPCFAFPRARKNAE